MPIMAGTFPLWGRCGLERFFFCTSWPVLMRPVSSCWLGGLRKMLVPASQPPLAPNSTFCGSNGPGTFIFRPCLPVKKNCSQDHKFELFWCIATIVEVIAFPTRPAIFWICIMGMFYCFVFLPKQYGRAGSLKASWPYITSREFILMTAGAEFGSWNVSEALSVYPGCVTELNFSATCPLESLFRRQHQFQHQFKTKPLKVLG